MASKPLVGTPLPLHKNPSTQGRQFNSLVRNIVNTHENLLRDHEHVVRAGYEWYDRAQEIADRIGKGDVHKGAGILAALSPQIGWKRNVEAAEQLVKTGRASGRTGSQNAKALRIHEGELPVDVLNGHKETHFYHNISDPNDPIHVTIDRHAHDSAVGSVNGNANRKLDAEGRYNIFHGAYTEAAGQLGFEVPSRLQAGIWTPNFRPSS